MKDEVTKCFPISKPKVRASGLLAHSGTCWFEKLEYVWRFSKNKNKPTNQQTKYLRLLKNLTKIDKNVRLNKIEAG